MAVFAFSLTECQRKKMGSLTSTYATSSMQKDGETGACTGAYQLLGKATACLNVCVRMYVFLYFRCVLHSFPSMPEAGSFIVNLPPLLQA